jgi:3-oxoacyl-[acyl-carrier-protein] synthase III
MSATTPRSKILGVAHYVPPKVVTNDDLSKLMDTSDEWITQRSGIKQRYWVEGTTSTSDLAYEACVKALATAKVKKEEIDLLLLCTATPDHEFPGTACFLQAKLDVPGIPAIDVRQQCTGFIYALSIADQFIRTGTYKKILIVCSEVQSKGLDLSTKGRDTAVLFGDGAGAAVIGVSDGEAGVVSTHIHADGSMAKELWVQAPGSAYAGNRMAFEDGDQLPRMNGKSVFVHAVRRMPEAIMEALDANQKKLSDVDLFVFHQANMRINEMVAKQLGIPESKVFNTIDRFANTTSATIPIGLSEAVRTGKLQPGMTVALAAFGSGFTWGSALLRW